MVSQDELYDGGNIVGEPNYAFNPYLEAGFDPENFAPNDGAISTRPSGEGNTLTVVDLIEKKVKSRVKLNPSRVFCSTRNNGN